MDMQSHKNITIVGSSHISKQSVMQVREAFKGISPEIVAVELDSGRAQGLFEKRKKPSKFLLLKMLGLGGFLFYVIGEFIQKKLGKIVNMDPGSEMKTAIILAKENDAKIMLIDREIQVTLSRFSRYFRKRELLKMVYDMFFGKKEKMGFDLEKVPSEEVIDFAINEVKTRYPSIYRVLIEERDIYMSRQLHMISMNFPDKRILAVVGAGHMKGILKELEKLDEKADNDKV
jgi:pheromone shutdown-related protein TraB